MADRERENPAQGLDVDAISDVAPTTASSSEIASAENLSQSRMGNSSSTLPFWYPKRCNGQPIYHGNGEALAWGLDLVARGVAVVGSGAFLGTALIRLAKEAAGCETELDPSTGLVPDCHGRVYGIIRPSSLLTTYAIIVGVVSTALMPLFGAILDYTNHRRLLGRCTSLVITLLLIPQMFLSSKTWFAVAILQLVIAFTGWTQSMVSCAYLPELTDSEARLNQYLKSFGVVTFASLLVYLVATMGIAVSAGVDDDEVTVARLGTSISFVVCCILLYAAWGCLFQERPPSRALPEGRSLWTAGFIQNYNTMIHIYRELPALKWFYLALAPINAAVLSFLTIMITYQTDILNFSSVENAAAILIILIGGIPGALMAAKTVTLFNPVRSNIMATSVLTVVTITVAVVLKGPGQQMETYILASLWGLGLNWKSSTDRLLASTLIPEGQDAELMGVFLLAGQILTWLPPLVFTALNEAGVSQSIGIGSLSIYLFLGLIALCMIGDYQKAVARTGRQLVLTEEICNAHGDSGTNASDPGMKITGEPADDDIRSTPTQGTVEVTSYP